jgi:pimeloyl-ACP methyl ester carboxylesterase
MLRSLPAFFVTSTFLEVRKLPTMKERLIMFVHGLGGAGETTWRADLGSGFPELIRRDVALSDEADVDFFEYPTSLFRLPFVGRAPRVLDLAEGLRTQIELKYPNHRSIALVCHSLGGLVARQYLVEEGQRAGSALRVDKLLLFAVPNHGSALAGVARHLSWQHNQLNQLCRDSEFLERLNKDWKRLDLGRRVAVRYVAAGQDRVVDKQSAIHQWGEENVDSILDAGHISVVKPRESSDLSYMIFRRFMLGPVPVFLSVGGTRNPTQNAFVGSVKAFLQSRGIAPKTVDEYGSTNRQPLKDVEYRMNRCYGAVVIAFERTHIQLATSRRGTTAEKVLQDMRLPPVWNQIEAAMAYTRGLPLLVLVEDGLVEEGMLESKYDWRVKRVDLTKSVVDDPEFLGIVGDWHEHVIRRRDAPTARA